MKHKKLLMVLAVMLLTVTMVFADSKSGIEGLSMIKKVFGTIYWFFCSTYMKVICVVALIFIGVKMYSNRGQSEATKTLIYWLIATILIGGGSAICGLFFEPDSAFKIEALTNGSYILEDLK